ncbi:MaoC/PaaZ C-terminal domain-containing protein [Rossellomorea aquimaris]|uniref:MaoC/PaaZ C-terminal domain-containing protein n=1 Tax=Rossellomorea aquimaris TaxID=189382 RepID=UPI0007D080F8|nr:MaoC/PaaZ C-terminal domain-containing protein [Rossellomorea aquimaris]
MSTRTIVTEEQVKEYGHVSEDWNSIHFDDNAAKKAGFKKKIVHGMLPMGIVTNIITPYLVQGFILQEYHCRFLKPVYIGEEIEITFDKEVLLSNSRVSLIVKVKKAEDDILLKGRILLVKGNIHEK